MQKIFLLLLIKSNRICELENRLATIYFNMIKSGNTLKEIWFTMLRSKKVICVFQVAWNLIIGTVGRIFFFFFVQHFHIGKIGKQYVRMGKFHAILYKSEKKVRVDGEKLGMVWKPETHNFCF